MVVLEIESLENVIEKTKAPRRMITKNETGNILRSVRLLLGILCYGRRDLRQGNAVFIIVIIIIRGAKPLKGIFCRKVLIKIMIRMEG